MRLPIEDGKVLTEWQWHIFQTEEGREVRLELMCPTATEHLAFQSRFKMNANRPDWPGALRHISQKWFRDFEGIEDNRGKKIENTERFRYQILEASKPILDFVTERVRDSSERETEKNADSGSD